MNKCLKILLKMEIKDNLLENFIQKNAKQFSIEGTAQAVDKNTIKITACGSNEDIDDFIDSLYQGYKKIKPSVIEVEPFLKDRDYRGVFRIIE